MIYNVKLQTILSDILVICVLKQTNQVHQTENQRSQIFALNMLNALNRVFEKLGMIKISSIALQELT